MNFLVMCYYKSEVEKYNELMAHYEASFQSITDEIDVIKEKFDIMLKKDDTLKSIGMTDINELGTQMIRYNQKDALPANLTKAELTELRWYQRFLSAYGSETIHERYYENGFDYFPTPIITAKDPGTFKMFNWGFYNSRAEANPQINTLNCISEKMWETSTFKNAIAKGQRCLIPVTGFYEWRWLDEKGTIKIPYYVTFRDQKVRSMAGLYEQRIHPVTKEAYNVYTLLTTKANTIMEYVHNNKKRMPVFIDKEDEKKWLSSDLKKDEVMELCTPYDDNMMRAYTISKFLTTRNINLNSPEVWQPFNYNEAQREAEVLLEKGDRKKALMVFKELMNASADITKIDDQGLRMIAAQEVKEELVME